MRTETNNELCIHHESETKNKYENKTAKAADVIRALRQTLHVKYH